MKIDEEYKKRKLLKINDQLKSMGCNDVNDLPSQIFCKEFSNLLIIALKSGDEKDIIAFLSHPINCTHFECQLLKVVDTDLSKLINTQPITSKSFKKILEEKMEQNTKKEMEKGK